MNCLLNLIILYRNFDMISVRTFDYVGRFSSETSHPAPLFVRPEELNTGSEYSNVVS